MKASIKYIDEMKSESLVEINDHNIQFGGSNGDGYCYGHQSFDCIDNLTDDEWRDIQQVRGRKR